MNNEANQMDDVYADYAAMQEAMEENTFDQAPATPFDDMDVASAPSAAPKAKPAKQAKAKATPAKKASSKRAKSSAPKKAQKTEKKSVTNSSEPKMKTSSKLSALRGVQADSPIMNITNSRGLMKEEAGLSTCRLANAVVYSMKPRGGAFLRKSHVVITNKANGRKVVRFVQGAGNVEVYKSMGLNDIAIDYDTRVELLLPDYEGNDLVVRSASWAEQLWFYLKGHHDHSVRWSTRLALLGATLGIQSFIATFF